MKFDFEIVVVGLGAMGSAAAYHCAKNGRRVLGLDRFTPPHTFGSSHGSTRIIREAYFEHPLYVPLVQRAYELWKELEEQSNHRMLRQTGGLMIGPPDGPLVKGARRSAEQHKLPHQVLTSEGLQKRFPAFRPKNETLAVWEPRAGILFPELAIQTHLHLAAQQGAKLLFEMPMTRWEPCRSGVRIFSGSNSWTAGRMLMSPGAWMSSMTPELRLPLSIERQVLFWFEPRPGALHLNPDKCPIFIWEYHPHRFFYGFPNLGEGVKIGIHHEGQPGEPDKLDRDVKNEEIKAARNLLEQYLPDAAGTFKSAVVCMYTNTPDEHFILDYHPTCSQVLLASPCSGHGFKFSPAIGEIAAKMLNGEIPNYDLSFFKVSRGALRT